MNDINVNAHIRGGGNVTHLLNIKVTRQPSNEIASQIRQYIFRRINKIPITINIQNIPITITWKSNAITSSINYYADVELFNDTVVKRHTNILQEMDNHFNNIFTNESYETTGVAFEVTRPLVREVALVDSDDDHDTAN